MNFLLLKNLKLGKLAKSHSGVRTVPLQRPEYRERLPHATGTDYRSSEPLKTLVMLCYARSDHQSSVWRRGTGCKLF